LAGRNLFLLRDSGLAWAGIRLFEEFYSGLGKPVCIGIVHYVRFMYTSIICMQCTAHTTFNAHVQNVLPSQTLLPSPPRALTTPSPAPPRSLLAAAAPFNATRGFLCRARLPSVGQEAPGLMLLLDLLRAWSVLSTQTALLGRRAEITSAALLVVRAS
jgi:hypothetical protein